MATAGLLIGTSIERSNEPAHHDERPGAAARTGEAAETGEAHSEAERRGEAAGGEAASGSEATAEKPHGEWRPLGINTESWPLVIAAALASLALALAAWLRPRLVALLALIALAMIAFAALDVAELIHQVDVDETGLAVLAGAVFALHLAAGVAAVAASRARGPTGPRARSAGTMTA
ncbi:MAG: hypothetical protein LC713_02555 [Actinobacteria bacterium]|nr:hypothetical protein [Actinomycetota bacterium]